MSDATTTQTGPKSGKCLCGAISFTAQNVEQHFHACHCDMCRRWSGGPGMGVGVGSVELQGEEHLTAYKSSDWAERCFCQKCGTNLFYRMPENGMTIVWAGAFDDESGLKLNGEIYVDEKSPAYDFAGDHSRQTGAEFMASIGMGPPAN